MVTRSLIGAVVVLCMVTPGPAASNGEEATLVSRIERAVLVSDRAALEQCRGELDGSDAGARYTAAYVDWRLSQLSWDDKKERKRRLKSAQATLEDLLVESPDDAEAMSLLGGVYGSQITGILTGIKLGNKSGKTVERAGELAPDNPRVLFQRGVSAFRTPKNFGGSLERAEELLREAASVFTAQTTPEPWPNWGRLDVYGFLGQVLAEKGDYAGARKAYRQGLTIAPENGWIRDRLMPALAALEAQEK